MTPEEVKELNQEVKRNKRLASETASQLRDPVEKRLPHRYHEISAIAQSTYDACKAWDGANKELQAAKARQE